MIAIGGRADTSIGKLDIESHAGSDSTRGAQRMSFTVANKRKPAREYPAIGVGCQQLAGTAKPLNATVAENPERAPGPAFKTRSLFPAALNAM